MTAVAKVTPFGLAGIVPLQTMSVGFGSGTTTGASGSAWGAAASLLATGISSVVELKRIKAQTTANKLAVQLESIRGSNAAAVAPTVGESLAGNALPLGLSVATVLLVGFALSRKRS